MVIIDLLSLRGFSEAEGIVDRLLTQEVQVILLNVPKGMMGRMGRNVLTLGPECSIQEIVNALGKWIPELEERVKTTPEDLKKRLARSERRVLKCLGRGMQNEAIAKQLCVSFHTVKTHLYHAYYKLNCRNRAEAALWAERYLQDD